MDEKNQKSSMTFANTRAETLRFGGVGVQHSVAAEVHHSVGCTMWALQL